MVKLTKRKGFNFFRSYYDVYNELNDKEKVQFMDALLDRQFLGVKPSELKGMAKFAYISQTNSIDSQVKGYEDKTKTKLSADPAGGVNENDLTPTIQVEEEVQEKGKGEVQVKEKEQYGIVIFPEIEFNEFWDVYDKKVDRSKCEKKFNSLGDLDKQNILDHINLYIQSTPDKQYRKNPLTYLNSRTWEDEELPTFVEKQKHQCELNGFRTQDGKINLEALGKEIHGS